MNTTMAPAVLQRGATMLNIVTAGYHLSELVANITSLLRGRLKGRTVNADVVAAHLGIDLDESTAIEVDAFLVALQVACERCGWRRQAQKGRKK